MKVALINHDYPPHIFGGIGNFTFELAKGLSRQGVKVYVITGYSQSFLTLNKYNIKWTVEDGVEVFRFPLPSIPPRHTVFQVCNLKKILKTIKLLNVDVIHGQCGATYPLIRNLKDFAPVLVTFHGSPLYERIFSTQSIFRGGSRQDFSTFLLGYPAWHVTYKKELQNSNYAVTVSESLKNEILLEMGKKHSEKIKCIHNGVDLCSLDEEYASLKTDISESAESTILFAGRLYWRKGALNIIELAYLLQKKKTNYKIIVHGVGPLFNKMQEYIRSLHLENIILRGFTTKHELLKSLNQCTFVAIPSVYEACPMILLEAMCLGKIPLMLNLPFSNELTNNGEYGILGDNMQDLCERLISIKSSISTKKMSNEIKMFARSSFDMNNVASEYIKTYEQILAERGAKPNCQKF